MYTLSKMGNPQIFSSEFCAAVHAASKTGLDFLFPTTAYTLDPLSGLSTTVPAEYLPMQIPVVDSAHIIQLAIQLFHLVVQNNATNNRVFEAILTAFSKRCQLCEYLFSPNYNHMVVYNLLPQNINFEGYS